MKTHQTIQTRFILRLLGPVPQKILWDQFWVNSNCSKKSRSSLSFLRYHIKDFLDILVSRYQITNWVSLSAWMWKPIPHQIIRLLYCGFQPCKVVQDFATIRRKIRSKPGTPMTSCDTRPAFASGCIWVSSRCSSVDQRLAFLRAPYIFLWNIEGVL